MDADTNNHGGNTTAPFTAFVLNPARCVDPALAIAGSRAGGVGVLNAELGMREKDLDGALRHMERHARNAFGLKVSAADGAAVGLALNYQGGGLGYLILDPETEGAMRTELDRFRSRGGKVFVEITQWDDSLKQMEADVDGLWIKGHEAGGVVGEQTSFILFQKVMERTGLPVFVRGGVNVHSAAAVKLSGAAGVVLDDQLLLLRESPLREDLATKLRFFTGQETILIDGRQTGRHLRIWAVPGRNDARELQKRGIEDDHDLTSLLDRVGWNPGIGGHLIPPLGQDAAVCVSWAEQFGSVAATLRAIETEELRRPGRALELNILGTGAPLAEAHGTRLPIVQGPMTHVSDRPEFIEAVAANGGLPMVAVSLMKGESVGALLRETRQRLGDRPWGVGLLGFVPPEILKDQRAAVRDSKPPFAIIAGGRPDQAKELEDAGIRTYLHVPSPVLLDQFLEQGSRHFIFEGRECGGHIGPVSSLVLWGRMTDTLIDHPLVRTEPEKVHVLFAGGIHDARSAAIAAIMAVPLAEMGVRVGILMGTGYVFTTEAVDSKSITETFQKVAVECTETVGLTTGPGHASRCAVTPFVEDFWKQRRDMERAGAAPEEIREKLEALHLGRLRMATKGRARLSPGSGKLSDISAEDQLADGMFMIGQAATIKTRSISIAELHRSVSDDAVSLLSSRAQAMKPVVPDVARKPADIAIVGIGCILPGAKSTRQYWENILDKVDAIQEIPPARWDWRLYFDDDRTSRDKIYSKYGGFIDDFAFDPVRFGMPPNSISSIDPMQLLALAAVEKALEDAGYSDRKVREWETTSVVIGWSGGLGELGIQYGARAEIPRSFPGAGRATLEYLPEWTEDSFAGLLPNVAAGRVTNRFNFGGANFMIDAACASSLGSIYQAVMELETGRSDLVLAGGVDTVQGPFGFLCFSKSHALSPTGRCRTFDAKADGIVISEGVAIIVLKRLADAERDGDRIYAVIKGVGASSDGRAKGLTAPLPAGQQRALRRAYAQAGFSPATLGLVEAHGTGTVAGDRAELETVIGILEESGAEPSSCSIGSVKTLIGHTKATAGAAGLVKAALALHHRILPPHFGVDEPNPVLKADECPLFLNQLARPWIRHPHHPRRAGVSSFGFGGTNFHVALEEYAAEYRSWALPALRDSWPAELLIWRAPDKPSLTNQLESLLKALEGGAAPGLAALSKALIEKLPEQGPTLSMVVRSTDDLREKLQGSLRYLATLNGQNSLPADVYFTAEPAGPGAKVAVLFSGQGSQYPDMMRELATTFTELSARMEEADGVLSSTPTFCGRPIPSLSHLVFPPARFTNEEEQAARIALTSTDVAQPALGSVEAGLWALLQAVGLKPDMAAGHSYGEYVALYAAGVLDFPDLLRVSEARGRFIVEATRNGELGTMAAISAGREDVVAAVDDVPDLVCANFNAPMQTIISGTQEAIARAQERLEARDIWVTRLPVAAGFHSPLMRSAQEPLAKFIEELPWRTPRFPVYANTTGQPHADDPTEIRSLLAEHLVKPVRFMDMVEAMYDDGARVFLEIGPKSVLSDLTASILGARPHFSVSTDGNGGGLVGFLHALAGLAAHQVPLDFSVLLRGRRIEDIRIDELKAPPAPEPLPRSVWLVNATSAYKPETGGRMTPAAQRASGNLDPFENSAARDTAARQSVSGLLAHGGETASKEATLSMASNVPLTASMESGNVYQEESSETNIKQSECFGLEYGRKEESMPNDFSTIGSRDLSSIDHTMSEYYRTMRQFLQTQERLMTTYLSGAANGTHSLPASIESLSYPEPSIPGGDTAPALGLQESVAPPGYETPPPPAVESVIAQQALGACAIADAAPSVVDREPAPPPPEPPAVGETAGESIDVKQLLLKLVSDRTGYPEDMLDLNQNIEADLGIDSIKRVEVLGLLQKQLAGPIGDALRSDMETLSKAPTLQSILDLVESKAGKETPRPFELAGEGPGEVDAPLPRFVIQAHPEPVDDVALDPPADGVFVITADDTGVGEALAARLARDGARPCLVSPALLREDKDLSQWLTEQCAGAPVRGVIHAAPIGAPAKPGSVTLEQWRDRVEWDIKALFPLLRLTAGDVGNGGQVISVSALGGLFGRDALENTEVRSRFPVAAGNVGLIKSLSLEWENCRCKAIDVDPSLSPEVLGEQIYRELKLPGGRREVGYPQGRRTIFRTVPASLGPRPLANRTPDQDWVVLAIGGARGITAETLRDLAARRVTLVLVGRTPCPENENPDIKACVDAEALRRHFMETARANGQAVRLVDIERKIQTALRDREIRSNTNDFLSVGARVDYRVADMRREEDVKGLLDGIYGEYGRIDAVLFGAGIIEDALLVNKERDSVARVFDTKVDSAFLLARHLRTESLRYLTFFTSVAGRYGNRGQTDYGAANETLNRLAWLLQAEWGPAVKVSALNWGPWSHTKFGPGMVTAETRRQFEERGVRLVEPEQGRWFVMQDLLSAPVSDVEVVAGDSPWEYYEERHGALPHADVVGRRPDSRYPFLRTAVVSQAEGPNRSLTKVIDLVSDPYLDHHRLDGMPVVPFVCAAEYMAEAAEALVGGTVGEMRNIRRFVGLTLERGKQQIDIDVRKTAVEGEYQVELWSVVGETRRRAYNAICVLGSGLPEAPTAVVSAYGEASALSVGMAYNEWLFHGPVLQTITNIVTLNERRLVADLKPTLPRDFYPPAQEAEWCFDPGVLDAALQLVLVWSRAVRNKTPLPSRIGRLQRFGEMPLEQGLTIAMDFVTPVSEPVTVCHFSVFDSSKRLRYRVDELETVASAELNRLGGGWARGHPEELSA